MKLKDKIADRNWDIAMNFRKLSHTLRSLPNRKTSQKRILLILDDLGEMTQKELTSRMKITTASASEILRKMEGYGLIERRTNAKDRRVMSVCLTEKGKEEAVQARVETTGLYEEMFQVLDSSEKDVLLTLLEKLNEDWDQRYPHIYHHERPEHKRRHGRHYKEE